MREGKESHTNTNRPYDAANINCLYDLAVIGKSFSLILYFPSFLAQHGEVLYIEESFLFLYVKGSSCFIIEAAAGEWKSSTHPDDCSMLFLSFRSSSTMTAV